MKTTSKMRRPSLLMAACALTLLPAISHASWPFLTGLGLQADDQTNSVVFDATGSAYVGATFSGTINIGGMEFVSAGAQDIAIVKLDSDGNVLWARAAGSPAVDNVAEVALDANGDLYVVGSLCLDAPGNCNGTFSGLPPVAVTGGRQSAYVAKIDASGTWLWVRHAILDSGTEFRLNGIAIDDGQAFVSGWFNGSLAAGTGGGFSIDSRSGRSDALFAKISGTGDWGPTRTWPTGMPNLNGVDFHGDSVTADNGRVMGLAKAVPVVPPRTSLAISGGPTYNLPGGGSCTTSGRPSLGNGATVSCSGVNIDAHTKVYYGLRNDQSTNGNALDVLQLRPFTSPSTTGNGIRYSASTPILEVLGIQTIQPATSFLELNVLSGSLDVVETGGNPADSGANGSIGRLFEVKSDTFSVEVDVLASSGKFSEGISNPAVFDPTDTPITSGGDAKSSVNLGFYYSDCGDGVVDTPEACDEGAENGNPTSCCTDTCTLRPTGEPCLPSDDTRLVVMDASDLAIQIGAADLGYPADKIASTGGEGFVSIGHLPQGESVTYGSDTVSGPALVIARGSFGNGGLSESWAASARDDSRHYGRNLTFANDTIYVTSLYEGVMEFVPETIAELDPMVADPGGLDQDVFVGALDDMTGEWLWATRSGGAGLDWPNGITTDPSESEGEIAIVGNYEAPGAFGEFEFSLCESTCQTFENNMLVEVPCNPLNANDECTISDCNLPLFCLGGQVPPESTAFAMKLQEEGEWLLPVERWIVGQRIPKPDGVPSIQPAVEIDGLSATEAGAHFLWAEHDKAFYAIKPTSLPATVKWFKTTDPTLGSEPVTGTIRFPDNPQIHMAGAPVDLELSSVKRCGPESTRPFALCERDQDCGPAPNECEVLTGDDIWTVQAPPAFKTSGSDATIHPSTKVFNATNGTVTLMFVNGPQPNSDNYPVAFTVVRTVDPVLNTSGEPTSWDIGTALFDDNHRDPNGKNGWVVHEDAFYDGVGPNRAYVRDESRAGAILPVNLDDEENPDDDMRVVWYEQDSRGIAWPTRPILYDCKWPDDPYEIIVASELGSDGRCADVRGACKSDADCSTGTCIEQPELDPQVFPEMHIYQQTDPELPGFNPNEEHALLLSANGGSGLNAVFAMGNDLNAEYGYSEPYVLLKYRAPETGDWAMNVYRVDLFERGTYTETYPATAGGPISPPYPLSILPHCTESCAPLATDCANPGPACTDSVCIGGSRAGAVCETADDCLPTCMEQGPSDPLCGSVSNRALFKDHTSTGIDQETGADKDSKGWWARSAGTILARYHYPIMQGFFTNLDLEGQPEHNIGDCLPWLTGSPFGRRVTYSAAWPSEVATLNIGETLLEPKRGLPAISTQAAAEVLFETTSTSMQPTNEPASLVRLIDPLAARSVPLAQIPADIITVRSGLNSRIVSGQNGTVKLSPGVAARLSYSQNTQLLSYSGVFDESGSGEPLLMLNVLTARERDELKNLSTDAAWDTAIDELYVLSRNPNDVTPAGDGLQIGFTMDGDRRIPERLLESKALTAGLAEGTGYVTLAFNNDPTLTSPVELEVIRVDCDTYQGQVQLIPSSNIFDEQITLRHSGDFAGDPGSLDFEWYYALKEKDCRSIAVPDYPEPVEAPWIPAGDGLGVSDITFGGPGITSLADTCVLVRYTGYPLCGNQTTPSQWAGAVLGPEQFTDPKSKLVPGWLTRVTSGLGPFDQKTADFRNNEVETLANLLSSAGERFEGPIAFNPSADALNSVGLIETYQTVLERGSDLSINEGINIGAVNSKLLDVAARVSDLYMLLGNEAFGDALDPTIGFDTGSEFGTAAPSIFAFQDQLDSLLSEELNLLRGRDDGGGAPPVYNKLIWNFTGRDGQTAYQQNYNIENQDEDPAIDEFDARILFPQGHGDAWGHYLTALKGYYALLRHPNFVWLPRSDSVLVAGTEVLVDFTDERRFATSAAARARTGAHIVDLTYRQRWVDDPSGQWQGYKDTDTDRAFGVSEWAQRAGQGAFFDWVVANAILPPQSDAPPGIEKIDRTTVPELGEIVSHSFEIQGQLDLVDQGMNPLGLAKNVVPFDINPAFLELGSSVNGLTHYEQIALRADEALANAVRVFDHANGLTQLLRRNQDSAVDFARNVAAQERDFNNRLIEIFGTPYPEDIGPGGTYSSGYAGPDVWNWDIVDTSELTGEIPGILESDVSTYMLAAKAPVWKTCDGDEDTCRFDPNGKLDYDPNGNVVTTDTTLTVRVSNRGLGKVKNPSWTQREAPGELQLARSELLQSHGQLLRATRAYAKLIGDMECILGTIKAQNTLAEDRLEILNRINETKRTFNALILTAKVVELGLKRTAESIKDAADTGIESLPKIVGISFDTAFGLRALLSGASAAAAIKFNIGGDVAEASQLAFEQAAEIAAQADGIELQGIEDDFEIFQLLGSLGEKLREEPILRVEAMTRAENVRQAAAKLQQILARGVRVADSLEAFRKKTASIVAESRYADMAFRVFRNDALQKYRAQFDLASRYVYLTAAAYDYDTNLRGGVDQAGSKFLTDIVRQRSLGQFVDGVPIAGSQGLGDVMAQMNANFGVLKSQLGFNNPQTETNRFSMRSELFRILPESQDTWRSTLAQHRVDNLWDIEEFRRFARPPRAEADGPLPGIYIPIPTNVTFGLNFFGWPLAGGDSAYDPTNFATKVRTVGVWFGNYNAQGLSNTPRVYLIPTGADVLRSPTSGDLSTRNWAILDQRIPVPFPIGQTALDNLTWIPTVDSLSDPIGGIRQFSSFRAYHDTGDFDSSQVTTESRAIGRSVWNTRWALIITGGTLLGDADEGLNTFIYGQPIAGEGPVVDPDGVTRDGMGIDDILLFFQTYALSGN